jgi:hypothetical protein
LANDLEVGGWAIHDLRAEVSSDQHLRARTRLEQVEVKDEREGQDGAGDDRKRELR